MERFGCAELHYRIQQKIRYTRPLYLCRDFKFRVLGLLSQRGILWSRLYIASKSKYTLLLFLIPIFLIDFTGFTEDALLFIFSKWNFSTLILGQTPTLILRLHILLLLFLIVFLCIALWLIVP